MRPTIPAYGNVGHRFSIEEMIYRNMEFESDNEANEYAKYVLGNSCFAVPLTEDELIEKKKLEDKFGRKFY